MSDEFAEVLTAVGPRLRALRQQRQVTLAGLSEETGISASTLSRLKSSQRRATLELLLPSRRRIGSRSTSWSAPRPRTTPASRCSRSRTTE